MKLVIAEDEYIEAEALKKIMKQHYGEFITKIVVCHDGQEVVRAVRQERPDIIFMDIEMPFQNGILASGQIREFDEETKIVMLTAYSDFDFARESIRNGVVDYIVKPYSIKTICRVMDLMIKDVQESRSAQKVATKMNELIGHEFIMKLVTKCEMSQEEKWDYSMILGLTDAYYFFWSGLYQEHEAELLEVRNTVKKYGGDDMNCRFHNNQYLIVYGKEKSTIEQIKKDAEDIIKRDLGQIKQDWGVLDRCFGDEEDHWRRELYDAVINKNISNALVCGRAVVECVHREFEDFDSQIVNVFTEMVENICEVEHDITKQLYEVLDIKFSVSYNGCLQSAWKEFEKNTIIIIQYLSQRIERKNNRMIEQAKEYIHHNYKENISLDDIAMNVNVSRFYLSRMFKTVMDINLKDYVMNYRIEQAKKMLLLGHTVQEATYACGFSDPAYFSKCFKKREGYPPGSYLKP